MKFYTPTPVNQDRIVMTPQSSGQLVDWAEKMYDVDYLHASGMTGDGVKVGILDTGIDFRHPDLNVSKSNLYDFTGEGYPTWKKKYNGHGNGVAGIIAAIDNNFGIKGWAPDVEIFGLKVLTESGQGDLNWIVEAVNKAIELDLDIINLSLGGPNTDYILEEALLRFKNSGPNKFIVAASGNLGNSELATYPARYAFVTSIGAHDDTRQISRFTADHSNTVDYYLPGEAVQTCWSNDGYVRTSGTSFAAPYFTSILACLISGGYIFNLDDIKVASEGLPTIVIPRLHSYLDELLKKKSQPDNFVLRSLYTEMAERHFALGQSIDKFKELLG